MDLPYFSRKYIWWQAPDMGARDPRRVISQVMNLGTFEDVQALRQLVGDFAFKQALQEARPGEFSERSWHHWHLLLGAATLGCVPPVPVRRYG